MKNSFKKLDNLLNYGIKRDGNIFTNDIITCEFFLGKKNSFYDGIQGIEITYSDLNGYKYSEKENFDLFNEIDLCDDINSENDKKERENSIIRILLNTFLNPKKLISNYRKHLYQNKIENREYYLLDSIFENNGFINKDNLSVYSSIKIKHEITHFGKGDNDSTVKKTKSYQYFIFNNDSLINDEFLNSMVPENQDISESIETWSTTNLIDSKEFDLNKHLTKKLQKKYDFKAHKEFRKTLI